MIGINDDWVPRQCGTCAAVFTGDQMELVDCGSDHPNACDCGSNSHKASYLCPACWARRHTIGPTFGEPTEVPVNHTRRGEDFNVELGGGA